ncbi:MAG: FtsX-like permease family protein [Verrucomicrobiaceae bacterium]|nr:FtsX-like permease family protein [Verrucomicrobiaceae bacterium]
MAFASFLMAQQSAIFWGVMTWTYAPMKVLRADIWVAAPQVEQINDYDPLRLIEVQRVRSVPGVAWASPVFSSPTYARMSDGSHKPIHLMGVDDHTLAGAPWQEVAGGIETLRQPDAVWIDEYGLDRLKPKGGEQLKPGDVFEINERRAVIAGVFQTRRAFSGAPFLVTTFQRAADYSLPQRRLATFIIAAAQPGLSPAALAGRIEAETGLKAFSEDSLIDSTLDWWMKNTGVPGSFLTTIIVSLIFGLIVAAMTFSGYVAQQRQVYAALRAMGASSGQLMSMLVVQSLSLSLLSFAVGLAGAYAFGASVGKSGVPPFLMTWQIISGVFGAQLLVGLIGPLRCCWEMHRIQPADVFRS